MPILLDTLFEPRVGEVILIPQGHIPSNQIASGILDDITGDRGFDINNPPGQGGHSVILEKFVQVAGLVPMFQNCESTDSFVKYCVTINSADSLPNRGGTINIDGVGYTYSYATPGTKATIKAAIDSILPAGFTSEIVVTKNDPDGTIFPNDCRNGYTAIIHSPDGSGAQYNGTSFSVTNLTPAATQNVVYEDQFGGGVVIENSCDIECDPRYSIDTGDFIADDRNFTFNVFANETKCILPPAAGGENVRVAAQFYESKNNDTNTFLFDVGDIELDFAAILFLKKYVSGVWTSIADLDGSSSLGQYLDYDYVNFHYAGFAIDWYSVYHEFGAGTYRIDLDYTNNYKEYKGYSALFCLQLFNEALADRTVRFDVISTGGNIASVLNNGVIWTLDGQTGIPSEEQITITDSVRIRGMFGYETNKLETTEIKYYNGYLKQVRNEIIKGYELTTEFLPMWLIQRLSAYGFMSDEVQVTDFNIWNPDYNLKSKLIRLDGEIQPVYNTATRYQQLRGVKFKEQQQITFRDIA